ncbi:MAG TPA: flavin reductase family protein [Mucilaginibacter sp.]
MIQIIPSEIPSGARYKLITGSIIPRPIGVISTSSKSGVANFAPFSYFNIVGHEPMALSFSIAGPKPDGTEKDTLRNAKLLIDGGKGEFVAHIATEHFASAITESAASLSAEQSEFDLTGLTAVKSTMVDAPRILEAPIAFECKTMHVIPIGKSRLIIGEIICMHFSENVLQDNYHIDYEGLKAIGRTSSARYCKSTEIFEH